MPRLLIAASGTGGHIFPALAIARSLPSDWKTQWLGVPDRLETEILDKSIRLTVLRVGGLQGNAFRKICHLLNLIFSSLKVFILIRREDVDMVFTTGGYIAAPAILGAKLASVPVILHESNAIPGKVTRFMGRLCDRVALGIPKAKDFLPNCNTVWTGTPVRKEFYIPHALPEWVPSGEGPLIVVMGGSQGAIKLNKMVRDIIPFLLERNCRIIHLTGRNDAFYQYNEKKLKNINIIEKSFTNQIPALLQHADFAISRAGASAISEFAISGTPAILIPYPQATDKHQDLNAAYVAEFGAGVIVHQSDINQKALKDALITLFDDVKVNYLFLMKENMKKIAVERPEIKIISLFRELIR